MNEIRPIILTFEDGNEYVLEFSRESVKFAENHGFVRDDVTNKMMQRIPELFFFAFRMHHPYMTKEKTDAILFEDLGGLTEELSDRLVALFNQPYMSLINDSGTPKNAKLKVTL